MRTHRSAPVIRWTAAALVCLLAAPLRGITTTVSGQQGAPSAATPPYYRVEIVSEEYGERTVMRRFVDGARSRTEIDNEGETYIVIETGDAARTMYTVVPSMKRVMKSTLPQDHAATADQVGHADAAEDHLELVGTETIDGRSVQKYRVKMPDSDGFVWVDPSTELPVRMEAGGGRIDMRHYEFTKPAPELFQIPKGYEVMDLDQMPSRFGMARMVAGGIAGGYATRAGESAGGNAGAAIGGAIGGPIGSMIGRFLGKKLGKGVAQKAVGAAVN